MAGLKQLEKELSRLLKSPSQGSNFEYEYERAREIDLVREQIWYWETKGCSKEAWEQYIQAEREEACEDSSIGMCRNY